MSPRGRKSVLLIGNFISGSVGTRTPIEDLADGLRHIGWNVLTSSSHAARVPRLADIVSTVVAARDDYDVACVDVFSGMNFVWAAAASLELRALGKPYILGLHGGNLPDFAARHPHRVRLILAGAKTVVAPTNYLGEQMRLYHSGITVIPTPMSFAPYEFRVREHPRPHLMWLRAFNPIYNPLLAPPVLALVRAEFPDARLTMVGPDRGHGLLEATRAAARERGVLEHIEFVGGVAKADVPAALQRGDIFINTTSIDNTPVTVLEALACGLPVVTTNVGGIPYLLKHEENALLVPPNDAAAMAAAVRRVLIEPGLAARLSRNGRRVAESFDWNHVLPQWDELLRTAVG